MLSVIVPSSFTKVVGHLWEAGQDRHKVVLGHELLGRVSITITDDADGEYAFHELPSSLLLKSLASHFSVLAS